MTTEEPTLDDTELHDYECEVCGIKLGLTEKVAFEAGWDYPPFMGEWGTVSPRTCGNCTIEKTVWWAIAIENKTFEDLTEKQQAFVLAIAEEVNA